MKKTLLILQFIAIQFIANSQNSDINLIPQPAEVKIDKGSFTISTSTTICYNTEAVEGIAEMLASKLSTPTGFNLKTSKGNKGNIHLVLNEVANPTLSNEGYTLESTNNHIIIKANHTAGLFYGMQTLLQLLPNEIESKTALNKNWTIPAVKITDYPRFQWRGLMLDVSRNFFSKEDVKSYIDQMARYKFNVFHWHLADDNGWRIEIKSLPKLTQIGAWRVDRAGHFGSRENPKPGEKTNCGGFYTQNDIKEIVKYAQERNITIVPEIDIPGHSMAAIASYPELSCTKDTSIKVDPGTNFADWYGNGTFKVNIDNTLNPSDEKVYEFLDKVFMEVAQLFPSEYIHVGGDECYKGYWKQDSGCNALMKKLNIRHIEDLQGYFMNRVEKILQSKGKKMLGWDEILEGGVSKDAAVMCWRNPKIGLEAAKDGHKVIMTPTAYCYLDYIQGEPTIEAPVYASLRLKQTYSFEPLPDDSLLNNILGGQGNLWSENIPTLRYAEYMAYPRAWALAEIFWTKKENKNWDSFIKRTENHFERSDIAQKNYSKAIYDPIISAKKINSNIQIEMQTEATNLQIYYTIDGTMPDNFATPYKAAFMLPKGEISLRVITYRDGKQIGHLIILKPQDIEQKVN